MPSELVDVHEAVLRAVSILEKAQLKTTPEGVNRSLKAALRQLRPILDQWREHRTLLSKFVGSGGEQKKER